MAKKNVSETFMRAAEALLESHGYTKQMRPSKRVAPIHSKWRTPEGDILFLHAALHNVLETAFCEERE